MLALPSSSDMSELVWSQVPFLAQGLPPLAALLHWYLQQPVCRWSVLRTEPQVLCSLHEQLQCMVKGASEVKWGWKRWQEGTSSQQQPQQQQKKKKKQVGTSEAGHAPEAHRVGMQAGQLVDILSQAGARQTVRGNVHRCSVGKDASCTLCAVHAIKGLHNRP
jgi:hypothetical protein